MSECAGEQRPRSRKLKLGGKVLLADDGTDSRKIVVFYLKKMGLDVTFAVDGAGAVQEVLRGNFDLVLMDIVMPVMDGLEATRALRAQGVKIPIVALTGNTTDKDIRDCIQAGCNAHLSKPFNRHKFFDLVGRYLTKCPPSTDCQFWESDESKDEAEKAIIRGFVEGLMSRLDAIERSF